MSFINLKPPAPKESVVLGFFLGLAVLASPFAQTALAEPIDETLFENTLGSDSEIIRGLEGENVYPFESAEMAVLFRNFDTLTREVTNLPNGIRTVTRSSDPEVMGALVSHVHGMINRVEQGDDPKVVIQSPTLSRFFELADDMNTFIEMTDDGIVVEQTSNNPELVIALQTHAAEVTELSDHGIQAVRDQMTRRGD